MKCFWCEIISPESKRTKLPLPQCNVSQWQLMSVTHKGDHWRIWLMPTFPSFHQYYMNSGKITAMTKLPTTSTTCQQSVWNTCFLNSIASVFKTKVWKQIFNLVKLTYFYPTATFSTAELLDKEICDCAKRLNNWARSQAKHDRLSRFALK